MHRIKESTIRNTLLGMIVLIAIAMGILNKSYLVSAMYILTLIPVAYLMRDNTYDLLYGALLVSTFYDYVLYVPGIHNVYLFHIVLGLCTLMTLYKIIRDRGILFNIDKRILIIFAIWFIYMCISVIWALNKQLAVKYIAIYIMMFCFILNIMIYNINKDRFNKTINILLILISLVVLVGFFEVLLAKQLPVAHHYDGAKIANSYDFNALRARPIAFSYNPNNLAATLGILLPICFFSINKFENIVSKIYFSIISIMGFAIVILTTSRTGLIAVVLGLSVYILYNLFSIKTIGIKGLIYPLILILGLTFSYFNAYKMLRVESMDNKEFLSQNDITRKMDVLDNIGDATIGGEGSINERVTIIFDVVNDVVKNKNIMGNGVGNVFQFLKNQNNTAGIYNPHSYPIEILADFGVPGILLYAVYYMYLLIQNIRLGIKKKSIYSFAAASGLIAFAPACFGPSSITYVFSYWILMAFSISCVQVASCSNDAVDSRKIKEFRYN